ncbi:DUF4123 domain-containing protein [Ralstonia solanacearum]|uniref:DUF4123 domain-containing protein n=1 Tax=Ralstonia solanacearum TaxID=305 RepID=UPI0023063DFF|nr:DUF4123 domain-containing protein [Ralstonia solanacearum]MDB0567588.1 DUF4123 domain-containing protein [Ralstonia solanacearum]MDB0577408.1 DUF4123 domain-containing protein [Ralstonia solanacearum]
MDNTAFRQAVLQHLTVLRTRWPDGGLYLLYVPGEDDPLRLSGNQPRTQAIVRQSMLNDIDEAFLPRVITLDCRRVAAYLLETDAALDDPLLEASIALVGSRGGQGGEETSYAVCGWIASSDDAGTIARRLSDSVRRSDPRIGRIVRLRWHDPRVLSQMWPQLPAEQRVALLGTQLAWVAINAVGQVAVFDAGAEKVAIDQSNPPLLVPDAAQWNRLHNVALVNRLLELWRERLRATGGALPQDAVDVLHRHVAQALRHKLDGRDAQTYVLVALGLREGFEQDTDWCAAIQAAAQAPGTFEDHVAALPEPFWVRYAGESLKHAV